MTHIILIDLSSIAHQLFHVVGNDPNPDATSIKTVERVRALASGQPHVAVCMDGPPYFRRDIDPAYKAQRDKENNAVIGHQIALAADALRADGFPVWQVKGFETDDIIASAEDYIATEGRFEPNHIIICSADKDLLQLVSDHVTFKSMKTGNDLDEAAVVTKFGVRPNQMRDYLTLVGDASDNIKGCKGVGAVKAAELLGKFGNIEGIYGALGAHGTMFTPSTATNLREFEPRMPTVRTLVTLRTDVPLPFEEVFRERVAADVATFGGTEEQMVDVVETLKDSPLAEMYAAPTPEPVPADPMRELAKAAEVVNSGAPPPKPTETQALATRPAAPLVPVADFSLADGPQTYAQAKLMAMDLFSAKLFSGYGSPAAVLATIYIGKELGLPPGAALRGFHIVESKHLMHADLIRARVEKDPDCEYFYCEERTDDHATFVTKNRRHPKEVKLTFSVEDGKRAWSKRNKDGTHDEASFNASGWGKNPADMCVARSSSKLARLEYPSAVHGFYAPEEME